MCLQMLDCWGFGSFTESSSALSLFRCGLQRLRHVCYAWVPGDPWLRSRDHRQEAPRQPEFFRFWHIPQRQVQVSSPRLQTWLQLHSSVRVLCSGQWVRHSQSRQSETRAGGCLDIFIWHMHLSQPCLFVVSLYFSFRFFFCFFFFLLCFCQPLLIVCFLK